MNTDTPLPPNTIRDRTDAPHAFTTDELADLGKKLQAFRREQTQVEAQFDSTKADYKARLSKIATDQDDTGRKISDGFEMRPVDALVTFHDPQQNRKTFRREDTGDVIREEGMTELDYNLPLFRNKDNKDATEPELPAVVTGVDDQGDITEHANAEEPAGTPLGDALDKVAALSEAPLLDLDLSNVTAEGHLLTNFRKAAKAAGWSEPQIAMLKTQLQSCDTVSRMKEVLQPHCNPIE